MGLSEQFKKRSGFFYLLAMACGYLSTSEDILKPIDDNYETGIRMTVGAISGFFLYLGFKVEPATPEPQESPPPARKPVKRKTARKKAPKKKTVRPNPQ